MKVRILKTGKVEEYEAGYAARLIEQGKAIPAPKKAEPDVAPCEGEAQAETAPEARKGRKK